MFAQSLPFLGGSAGERQPSQSREFVTPQVLVATGIVSNALFWSGLAMPFRLGSPTEVAFLHVFSALLGLALALGGAVSTLMLVHRKVTVSLRSFEFAAGLLNISVLTATGTLLFAAFLRGM